jgi:hypothetical protein
MVVISCRLNTVSHCCYTDDYSQTSSDLLFCPTVGPILSGGMPGVGLYSVFIFSSVVYVEY